MMDIHTESRTGTSAGPLEHFQVTVRIAECSNRPAADEFVNTNRFAILVVDEVHGRQFDEYRYAVSEFQFLFKTAADHLLWGNAMYFFSQGTHELHSSGRDNKGLETVGAKITEEFDHRLIGEIRVGPFELRMRGPSQPVLHDLLELGGCDASVCCCHDGQECLVSSSQGPFEITFEKRGERLGFFPFRMLRRQFPHAIQSEEKLKVHGLLSPEGTVVVERHDALRRRYKIRSALLRHFGDEFNQRFLYRAVVP